VRREGKRVRGTHLELRVASSPLSFARVGFIVPKHGQSCVARNRLKRRLRELVRVTVLPTLAPQDLVIRTLPGAYALRFDVLRQDVALIAGRLTRRSEVVR
jgi:ribonuclease P protein component